MVIGEEQRQRRARDGRASAQAAKARARREVGSEKGHDGGGQGDGEDGRLGGGGGDAEEDDEQPPRHEPVGPGDEQADADGQGHQHDVGGVVPVVIRGEAGPFAQPGELVGSDGQLKQAERRQRQAQAEEKTRAAARGFVRDDDARHAPQHGGVSGPQDDGGPGLVRRRGERPQGVRVPGRDGGRELKAAEGRDGRREKPEPGAGGGGGRAPLQEDGQREQEGQDLDRGARPRLDASEGEHAERGQRVQQPFHERGRDADPHDARSIFFSEST